MDVEIVEFYNQMLTQNISQSDYEKAKSYIQMLNMNADHFADYTVENLKDKMKMIKKIYNDKYVLLDRIHQLKQLFYKTCSQKTVLKCFTLDQYFNYHCDLFDISFYYKQLISKALRDIDQMYIRYNQADKHFAKFRQFFLEVRDMLVDSKNFLKSIDTSIHNDYMKKLKIYKKYFKDMLNYALVLLLPFLHDEVNVIYDRLLTCEESLKHQNRLFVKI